MFRTCLKHDVKSFYKLWLIAAAAVFGITVASSLGMCASLWGMQHIIWMENEALRVLCDALLGCVAAVSYMTELFSLAILVLGTAILVYVRYYTQFFTDQGYLTFTLPVKRSTLFWSKVLSGYLYTAATGIWTVLCFGIFLVVGFAPIAAVVAYADLTAATPIATGEFVVLHWICGTLFVLLLVVLSFVVLFAEVLWQYLIITLAATLFRKLKILVVLAAYYVVNQVLAYPIVYIGMYYLIFCTMFGAMGFSAVMASVPILLWIFLFLMAAIGIVATVAVGLLCAYFTIWRLERKLNLY